MPSTTCARHLILCLATTFATTSGAALARVPAQVGQNQPAAQPAVQPDSDTPPESPATGDSEETAVSETASSASAAFSIARWMRAIGGRISRGPRIDSRTRVSMPSLRDARQGWRVSVPTFAHARMSAPPRRAALVAKPEQAADSAQEQAVASAESTDTPD